MAKQLITLPEQYGIDIDPRIFNETFLPYLDKIFRYEVYMGGSGSGKSKFVSQKMGIQMSSMPGRNMIGMRKQKTDCIDSVFPELYNSLRELQLLDLWKIKENPDVRLTNRINGNEIVFTGVDDIENIKSIKFKNGNVTDFVYEEVSEENDVRVIRELDRRLRDFRLKSRIILLFNPINRNHWLYDFVTKELVGTDSLILKTTYKDNRFLPPEYIDVLERYKYTDPYAYQVYALGEWGTTGQTVFNANLISNRLDTLRNIHKDHPPVEIEFKFERDDRMNPMAETFKYFHCVDGETKVYKMPEPKVPYVMAFDTAGEGVGDYYAAHVINNITGEQVATYHSQQNPDVCVLQLFGLATMYNEALVCPEVNFSEYPLKKFQELGYTNFYRRVSPGDAVRERLQPQYGFRTLSNNRKAMLDDLLTWSNEHISCINDPETLNEMLTFTAQSKKMKGIWWGAEAGAHDDLVMSLAIVLQARSQQFYEMVADKTKVVGFWTENQLELAVIQGRVDIDAAKEYIKERKDSGKDYNKNRRSRYAR